MQWKRYEFILSPSCHYSFHMIDGWNGTEKSHNANIDSCIPSFLSLCFCLLRHLMVKVSKIEKRQKMRKIQSVNTVFSPQGKEDIQYHKHSGSSIWRGHWKTVERHVVSARKITHNIHHIQYNTCTFTQTNTQAFFYPLTLPLQINKHQDINKTELFKLEQE